MTALTTDNYFEQIKKIDVNSFPSLLIEEYRYVKELTEEHTTWKYYKADQSIRETVDEYLEKVNRFIKQQGQSSNKPIEKVTPKGVSVDNARQKAKKLIWAYVQRGDSLESIKQGQTGASVGDYSARVRSGKIEVSEIDGHKVNFSFPLTSIYNEVKASLKPHSKPGKNENHHRKG